jgi:hypothetical protein
MKAQVATLQDIELRTLLKTISRARGRGWGVEATLGATRMNNRRMIRTRLDNPGETSPRSRTDLTGAGRPHGNLRIRRSSRQAEGA